VTRRPRVPPGAVVEQKAYRLAVVRHRAWALWAVAPLALLAGCAPSDDVSPPVVEAGVVDLPATQDDRALPDDRPVADAATLDSPDASAPSDAADVVNLDSPAAPPPADAVDAPPVMGPLFDLAAIRDARGAACTYGSARTVFHEGALVQVRDASYQSWESIDGVLVPITIRGYLARPAGLSGRSAGVILAHGLGGAADEGAAAGLAARTGTTVLAYTGPGGGTLPSNTSGGRASAYDRGRRMFDTLRDPRGSWFWGHVTAAMRGLTCLASHPEVDGSRLGMTGFSAGSVATLVAAGTDDRIVAAVALSGTLAWDVATRAPNAWQHSLLTAAGLDTTSPGWTRLLETVVSPDRVRGTAGNVLMMNGTTDEFFPLTAHLATFDALPPARRRMSLSGNFDHGCYSLTGIESRAAIEERADLRAKGAQRMWFGRYLTGVSDYARLPSSPTMTLTPAAGATLVTALVDETVSALPVEEVRFWWSGDRALTFASVALARRSANVYAAVVPVSVGPDAVVYVDAQFRTRALVSPGRFSLSSPPVFASTLVPQIRRIMTCTP